MGNVYTDQLAVAVLPLEGMDRHLKGIWEDMKHEILSGNNDKALEYYYAESRQDYLDTFNAMGNELQAIFTMPEELILLGIEDKFAKYEYLVTEGGLKYSYPLVFIRNMDGVWKILYY